MELFDRHVVVTGGSRGIGLAIANRLRASGARLTLVARDASRLAAAAASVDALGVPADLARPADVAALGKRLEDIAPVDVLVNNAGLDRVGRLTDLDADALHDLWQVNLVAAAELTRQLLPGMLARRRGRLVFVSSLSAEVAMPGLTAYSASKAALSQFAEGLRAETRGSGVGVTLVEVATVDTDMYGTVRDHRRTAAAFDRMHQLRLLRPLTVDEVADAVVGAIRDDRGSVVLPRRGRPLWALARSPQWLANLVRPRD